MAMKVRSGFSGGNSAFNENSGCPDHIWAAAGFSSNSLKDAGNDLGILLLDICGRSYRCSKALFVMVRVVCGRISSPCPFVSFVPLC